MEEVLALTEELRASGLERPRRLARGAVLPEGHLDLAGQALGGALDSVLAALDPRALRGLWLRDNDIGPDACARLASWCAGATGLVHLDLAGNAIGGAAPACARLCGLQGLDLGGCGLDLAESGALLEALRTAEVLHVGLGRAGARRANQIDVFAWAAALRRDPPWVGLDLRGVPMGEEEVRALVAALDESRLRRLDVDAPLPARALARLCDNANRRRVPPPPSLERLRARVPAPAPAEPPLFGLDAEEVAMAVKVLGAVAARPALLTQAHPRAAALRTALREARRGSTRAERQALRAARAAARRAEDRARVEAAEIRRSPASRPDPGRDPGETIAELHTARPCYVCRRPYTRLHFYYDRLCPECAARSYARRCEVVDLRGRFAVVTGGRVKIGHHVALRLLAWGARVLVTTRFPADAARRFAAHPDFAAMRDRLQIVGLDLRAIPAVERFADELAARERVDILVNNAAQTVRRPLEFYAPLLAGEAPGALPEPLRALVAAPGAPGVGLAPVASGLFPAGSDDGFGQPLDLRESNSWRLRLDEVGAVELLEVQLVNAAAPFVLCGRLRRAMARAAAAEGRRDAAFIVNVSAPEGRFDRAYKSPFHPHTNMAKAALNMMTRTSAGDYAEDGIYMTSVDTGWVSNENPRPIADAMEARGFRPPLDLVDAAARVCDPIARGLRDGELLAGVFLKDFEAISW